MLPTKTVRHGNSALEGDLEIKGSDIRHSQAGEVPCLERMIRQQGVGGMLDCILRSGRGTGLRYKGLKSTAVGEREDQDVERSGVGCNGW